MTHTQSQLIHVNFLVVVYSTRPDLTTTLKSLATLDFQSARILPKFSIWDNSEQGFGEASISTLPGEVTYHHSGRNEPLSKVYNTLISNSAGSDYFIVLDDDSSITNDYISSLDLFFRSSVPVGVPQILFNQNLISPGVIKGVRGRALNLQNLVTGPVPSKNIVAMMSGTVISKEALSQGLKFDERLNFYGVDTRFFIDYANVYSEIFILKTSMLHSSALRETGQAYTKKVQRFRNLILSRPLVFDYVKHHRFKISLYVLLFSLNTCLKEKNIRYLSLMLLSLHILNPRKSYAR
ncbi:glycosyltransferase family protein [Pseudomonas sp. MDT1-85]